MEHSKKIKSLKITVDANTLMRGVIHPRFAFEIFNHAFKSDFHLFLLPYTIEEAVRNVAKIFPHRLSVLEQLLVKCPYTTLEDPQVSDLEKHHNLIRHKKDLPLAVAAIKNRMDYIVSNDKDFTADHATTAKVQSKINCITAGNFLKKIMGWTSEELETIQRRKFEDGIYQFGG